MRWSRSQIYRMNSSLRRRYDKRFSVWPFPLYIIPCPKSTEEEVDETIQALIDARRKDLDTYAYGISLLFPTKEQLKSKYCKMVLKADFDAHLYGIDFVERLNSGYTSGKQGHTGPARNAVHASRQFMLKQMVDVHISRGGRHPLDPEPLGKSPARESVAYMPLLDACSSAQSQGPSSMSSQLMDSTDGALHALEGAPPVARGAIEAYPAQSHGAELVAQRSFEEPLRVDRENPALIVPSLPANHTPKQGLNPRLLERNKYVQTIKEQRGKMTRAEYLQVIQDFDSMFVDVPDRDVYRYAYDEWRHGRSSAGPQQLAKSEKPYAGVWGGGCRATPITKEELYKHIEEHGWPTYDKTMGTDLSDIRVERDLASYFGVAEAYNLWGATRAAKNVDRSNVKEQFDIIEKRATAFH